MAVNLEMVRVLVVDDDFHMIEIVKTLLRGFGIKQLSDARDAADAFDRVREGHVDVIITDYLMDLLDGVDFVRLVRTGSDSPDPYVPIIMLTSYSDRARVIAARDAGVTEYCCKPVTANTLWRKLAACINQPRSFVRTPSYFGPDRRRRREPYFGDERRSAGDSVHL